MNFPMVQEFTVYEPVSLAWSYRCVRSPTNLSNWRLHCWTADVLNANILFVCVVQTLLERKRRKLLHSLLLMFLLMHRELSWNPSKWWRLSTKNDA